MVEPDVTPGQNKAPVDKLKALASPVGKEDVVAALPLGVTDEDADFSSSPEALASGVLAIIVWKCGVDGGTPHTEVADVRRMAVPHLVRGLATRISAALPSVAEVAGGLDGPAPHPLRPTRVLDEATCDVVDGADVALCGVLLGAVRDRATPGDALVGHDLFGCLADVHRAAVGEDGGGVRVLVCVVVTQKNLERLRIVLLPLHEVDVTPAALTGDEEAVAIVIAVSFSPSGTEDVAVDHHVAVR